MREYQNHLIDPTYFFDVIEEFAFDYDLFILIGTEIDDTGRVKNVYDKQEIRGSLQSKGFSRQLSKSGVIETKAYSFYCKSLYRINIGDILMYRDNFYIVTHVNDYDEFGVRSCEMSMTDITIHRDLYDYIKYLRGEKLI